MAKKQKKDARKPPKNRAKPWSHLEYLQQVAGLLPDVDRGDTKAAEVFLETLKAKEPRCRDWREYYILRILQCVARSRPLTLAKALAYIDKILTANPSVLDKSENAKQLGYRRSNIDPSKHKNYLVTIVKNTVEK